MARIDDFESTPISNPIQVNEEGWTPYRHWMYRVCRVAFDAQTSYAKHAQSILGRQDFCWIGAWGTRNWVWVREFQADLGDGRVETWRWRLFVRKRGHSLEVEDKYKRSFGKTLLTVGPQALDHFIKTWETGK